MTHRFSTLIRLPRLSARTGVALCMQLETAARPWLADEPPADSPALPAALKRAYARMSAHRAALEDALQQSTAASPIPPQSRVEADRALDRAWSAFYGWLTAWARLAPEGELPVASDEIKNLRARIFDDGLQFTRLPYAIEWVESRKRLALIDEAGRAEAIAALGGAPFLDRLQASHARYGVVLGITEQAPTPEDGPNLTEGLAALREAMQDVTTKILALREPDAPAIDATIDALLRPIVDWDAKQQTQNGGGSSTEPARPDADLNGGAPEPAGDDPLQSDPQG